MAKKDTKNDKLESQDEAARETPEPARSDSTDEIHTLGAETSPVGQQAKINRNPFRRLGQWCGAHKRVSIPLGIVIVLGILFALPPTRYPLAGLFLRQTFEVEVLDAQTHKPVSAAVVAIGGKTQKTDATGKAKIDVKVGSAQLEISKNYYKTAKQTVLVPVMPPKHAQIVSLQATGRQVVLAVTNTISGKPVADVIISGQGVEAKTGKDGQAVVVVPANMSGVEASLKANGYDDTSVTIEVSDNPAKISTFHITPAGKVYFLSNLNGSLDVVKTNLDGTDRKSVLQGTGKEDKRNTVLLASRDWKYLALLSKRDGGDRAKLFLLDTTTDQLTTMDEGNADFSLVGWVDHRFVYKVNRAGYQAWQPGADALKSYDASTRKITLLDQTAASGTDDHDYSREILSTVYTLGNGEIIYAKNISLGYGATAATDRQATINSIKADGSDKHIIKGFGQPEQRQNYIDITLRPYGPNGFYAAVFLFPTQYYEYEDGNFKPTTEVNGSNFYDPYPTYLQSPSGRQTFWSESRDGKNTLFVGNADGKNGKQVAALSEYQVYGWYSDNYLLVSKNGSELYVLSVNGGKSTKMTDYYKPEASFNGYGGGYGGL